MKAEISGMNRFRHPDRREGSPGGCDRFHTHVRNDREWRPKGQSEKCRKDKWI